jgi:hypothetical protein
MLAIAAMAVLAVSCGGGAAGTKTETITVTSGGQTSPATAPTTSSTADSASSSSSGSHVFAQRTFCGPRVCPQFGTAQIIGVTRTSHLSLLGLKTIEYSSSRHWFPNEVGDYIVLTIRYQSSTTKTINLSHDGLGAFDLALGTTRDGSEVQTTTDLLFRGLPLDILPESTIYAASAHVWEPCILPANGTVTCSQYVDLSPAGLTGTVEAPSDLQAADLSDSVSTQQQVDMYLNVYPSSEDVQPLDVASGISRFKQVGPTVAGYPDSSWAAATWVNQLIGGTDATCQVFSFPRVVHLPGFGTVYHCGGSQPGSTDTTESLCAAYDISARRFYNVSQQVDAATEAETTYC